MNQGALQMKQRASTVVLSLIAVFCVAAVLLLVLNGAKVGANKVTGCIRFSSATPFSVSFGGKSWDGKLEFSRDEKTWEVWSGESVRAGSNKDLYTLSFRGTGNTKISSGDDSCYFNLDGDEIACDGNIENLLDYQSVASGQHPAMGKGCFDSLFMDCASLVRAPEIPATKLAESCYKRMFDCCFSLSAAPALPATELADDCYYGMFESCMLAAAPVLPATELADGCYADMFFDCDSLIEAPALPATKLAYSCYDGMFSYCESLTVAPQLPATTLAYSCYSFMFSGCSSLTKAPELPATTLADGCYTYMFSDCTSLAKAPKLPATTLDSFCYSSMFSGCTSLTKAPELPATTLESYCYHGMFSNCTSLTEAPELPATTLADHCYDEMFAGTNFVGSETPTESDGCIRFSSGSPFFIGAEKKWNGTVEYSTDGTTWATWDGRSIEAGANGALYTVSLRGTGNVRMSSEDVNHFEGIFVLEGAEKFWECPDISCDGNIENLLDYQKVANNQHPVMGDYCFYGLFGGCAGLVKAPELPATKLAKSCYERMFFDCTSLTEAPALPATELADFCYYQMFFRCESLTEAPVLPATTLARFCYAGMFCRCNSLTKAPSVLPATTLAEACYEGMFCQCSLTTPPELPATTLAENCYSEMFLDCTSLTKAPVLPATKLSEGCYNSMFYYCSSLTTAPELPATELADFCYNYMFCATGIELSPTPTDEFCVPWCIPVARTAKEPISWNNDMFPWIVGTSSGDPQLGVTYYQRAPR